MKRLRFALLAGGIIGAFFGLVETLLWLPLIPWWRLELDEIPAVMAIYAGIGAAVSSGWTFFARRLGADFEKRTIFFNFLTMTYLLGGLYINWIWFPEIYTPPSLIFTGLWTLAWIVGVALILKFRTQTAKSEVKEIKASTGARNALALLVLTAGISLLPSFLGKGYSALTGEGAGTASVVAGKPNLLLIVMDTTRAGHLSPYGYPRETTPHLDRLAQESTVFEQANAPAPWTLPSHASLFTGLYPSQHGANWSHQRLDNQFLTMAEVLRDAGYQTAAFTNNPWISQDTNFHQGFDYFEETWLEGRLLNRIAVLRTLDRVIELLTKTRDEDADLTNRDLKRWFEDGRDPNRPFFIFVNYLEPHFGYEPPQPYRQRFLREDRRAKAEKLPLKKMRFLAPPVEFDLETQAALTDLYDGEIAYLDQRLGELIADLERQGLLDETLVIVTSDHGEHIGDHRNFQHQFSLYESLLHVPLIVRYPKKFSPGARVSQPVSLVDIMPTVTEMAGLDLPELRALWIGSSLLTALQEESDRWILADYPPPFSSLPLYERMGRKVDKRYFTTGLRSIRRGEWKLIKSSNGELELYNLSSDTQESKNRIQEFHEMARQMEEELENQTLLLKRVGTPEVAEELDEVTRERLQGLGYLH